MDVGAWWAAVHGVAKSRTWLSGFTFTFHFYALEKEMATHSSVLAWRIPGTGESGGLPSMGLHRVGHDWSDLAAAAATFSVNHLTGQRCSLSSALFWMSEIRRRMAPQEAYSLVVKTKNIKDECSAGGIFEGWWLHRGRKCWECRVRREDESEELLRNRDENRQEPEWEPEQDSHSILSLTES